MIRLALSLLLSIGILGHAIANPAEIRLCTENEEAYPWLLNSRPGLDIILLKRVEKTLDLPISIHALPWKRCVAEVQAGNLDGAIKISFKPERLQLGVFPMLNGLPDKDKRLHTESYNLYVLKGASTSWDGQRLTNMHGPVGAQAGFSIIGQLKELGAMVDDATISANINLEKLLLGRVSAVALQTQEADHALAVNPKFANAVEKIGPPLAEKPYYVMLSKEFFANYPVLSNTIWSTMAAERESKEFQKILANFH